MFKSMLKGASAFSTIMVMTFTLMPATESEQAALGANPDRLPVIQMRLARAMLNVAPEFTVAQYSQATNLPPDVIRAHLEAKALGLTPQTQAAAPSNTRAGGAKFVSVD